MCNKGELTQTQVDSIFDIAIEELERGIAGPPEEEFIFEYCKNCEPEYLNLFVKTFSGTQDFKLRKKPDKDLQIAIWG